MADEKNKKNQPPRTTFSFIIIKDKKVKEKAEIARSKGPSGGKANKK